MREVDPDPEYVRERIEKTNNLGLKYLISVGLCAILIATMQGGFGSSDLFAETTLDSHRVVLQTSLRVGGLLQCS